MNKVVAWETAVSWGIHALNRQIERLEDFEISTSYDRSKRADLLELQAFLTESLQQWRSGELEYVVLPGGQK